MATGVVTAAGAVAGAQQDRPRPQAPDGAAEPPAPQPAPQPAPPEPAAPAPVTIEEEPLPQPPAGIDTRTFAEAEKLAGIRFTDQERQMLASSVEEQLARLRARQAVELPLELPPAQTFDPRLPGFKGLPQEGYFDRSPLEAGRPPLDDEDIAFAPLSALSRWVQQRMITSQHLTRIYLRRLERYGRRFNAVVTLLEERAMAAAREADIQIASGHHRGPLHGIPWGAKDLFDTAGIATTFGAGPYRQRVPETNAAVVERLEAAGAIMLAKLSLGALAYGDIWFGGRTRNPFNPTSGSSGSSAGSAVAATAGLAAFTLGTETYGSIVSPCMACGATGLRPTFGRVSRFGAMPLCWSLDKVGPICRTVEDCMLVLDAINGADPRDPGSIEAPITFDANQSVEGLRVGYDPRWLEPGGTGTDDDDAGRRDVERSTIRRQLDRAAVQRLEEAGVELVEIELPDWPYDVLLNILFAEAASAFEPLTRTNRDDQLAWQDAAAWPNTFRRSWFIPAIEYVQADRFRRKVMIMMAERFEGLDAVISPSFASSLLLITNNTGHPALTLRTGFLPDGTPHGITLWGRLFDEGTLARLGMALERMLDVWKMRPPSATLAGEDAAVGQR